MKWKIAYIFRNNIIHVKTKGEMYIESLNTMITEIAKAIKKHKSKLILIDYRKAIPSLSITDIYYGMKRLENIDSLSMVKVAEVTSKFELEKFKFFELLSKNRGYQISIFQNIDLAKKWLINA